jgi:capsular exopolysaccharide synthesis family protein
LNLAVSLAQMEAPVLLIEADLRRPSCHELLGVERLFGLTEVLAGQCELAGVVRPIKPPLFFLGSGVRLPPDPIELLASERMKVVLEEARRDYAFVLIDAPPLLPISDAVALSPLVDGVVLVISNKTPKPVVLKACERLDYARARILGAVLNGFDWRATGEEYANYYHA